MNNEIFEREKAILSHYKLDNQLKQLQSELKELFYAVEKHLQKPSVHTKNHIIEEIADVYVMLDQIKYGMVIKEEEIELWKDFKTKRQVFRIGEIK